MMVLCAFLVNTARLPVYAIEPLCEYFCPDNLWNITYFMFFYDPTLSNWLRIRVPKMKLIYTVAENVEPSHWSTLEYTQKCGETEVHIFIVVSKSW